MVITDQLTNGMKNPTAIDLTAPVFAWRFESPKRNTRQSAYQIIVREKLAPRRVVWDSGKTTDSRSCGIVYHGPSLTADTAYAWTLRIWSDRGEESESREDYFRTGLADGDWTAKDLWDGTEEVNRFLWFRHGFECGNPIIEAVVYVTAHNDYQLFLNGEAVGVGPARCDPYSYGQYCAYDITASLRQGSNAFAALVHWHGAWHDSGTNAQPTFRLEARIRYADGSRVCIATDEHWRVNPAAPYRRENPVYFGFYGGIQNRVAIDYDARLEDEQWKLPDADDHDWQHAVVVDRSTFRLYAQRVGGPCELSRAEPVNLTCEDGVWRVDFGKCLTGWPTLTLHENRPGDVIRVQYWEVAPGWGDAGYDTYHCKGGTERFYVPYVRHTSFRILEIAGYAGTLHPEDVRGIISATFTDKQGDFTCSDARMNAVYTMCERSGRQNYQQGIISVDANREQSPWTADSWNIGMGYRYNYADTMAIDKIIRDYAGEQLESGSFLSCSPARQYPSELAEWSLYWPMLLWAQYQHSGDATLLSEHRTTLRRFTDYMDGWQNPDSGLYNPPGWRASDYAGGTLENGGENIATNCQIYHVYRIAAAIASALGRSEEVTRYEKRADALRAAINTNLFVDGCCYRTKPDSEQRHPLGLAWALRFNILPEPSLQTAAEWLASHDTYDIGGYGGDALYSGLYSAGLGKRAAADFARYERMLASNGTNFESFGELSQDNMGNHAWTAYPAYLLPKYVGGITPTAAGFAEIEIKPVTSGLRFANAAVPTIKGMIRVGWEHGPDGSFQLTADLPANTLARIYLPDRGSDTLVTESGQVVPLSGANEKLPDGVCRVFRRDGFIQLEVGSGCYNFAVSATK